MNITALLRRHFRSPPFALTVFLLVAAVVAINAVAFGAIHTLRWKALPYAATNDLVWLQVDLRKIDTKTGLGEQLRLRVAEDRAHFAATAGVTSPRRMGSDSEGRSWRIATVTPGIDAVLGVVPALGRSFVVDDAQVGADRALVISDALWRSRFGADPKIIGHTVRFADRTDTIIGVMPRGFAFPDTTVDAWRPYASPAGQLDFGYLEVVARLAAGTSMAQAREALDVVLDGGTSLPGVFANLDPAAAAEPWRDHFFAEHEQALSLLQFAALVLLAAVIANLLNLQLDRLLGRSREFDIRRALGARERDITASVVSDTLPPLFGGLLTGLALSVPGLHLLQRRGLLPEGMPVSAGFDAAMLFCGLAIALVVLATAAFAARLSSGRSGLSARPGTAGLGRVRPVLIVGQIVLTTALLGGAGLLLRSAVNVVNTERGFDAQGVLMTGIELSNPDQHFDYDADARADASLKSAIDDLRTLAASLPGVQHVALANITPFSGGEAVTMVQVAGQSAPQQVRLRTVTPGYFAALGIGRLSGRDFETTDIRDSGSRAVIVDELYAQRYLGGADPLASWVGTGSADGINDFNQSPVIGVVRTAKQTGLDEEDGMPTIYTPSNVHAPMFTLLLRASGDPATLVEPMRRMIQTRVPDAVITFNQPLAQRIERSLTSRRALLEAVAGAAAMTLALSAIGLAAVLGFAIRRRTSELGVRMALGATPARVRNLVMQQGGVLIAMGSVLGLVAGLPLARLLADRLYGVTYTDAQTWLATVAIVAVVALFACWLPARRAAATDPMVALRHE